MIRRPAPVPRVVDPPMPRWWEGLVGVLTVLSCLLVAVAWGMPRRADLGTLREVLTWLDVAFCVVFLADFFVRLRRSEARWTFFKQQWIELIGSIPVVGPLRAVRIVRLVRIVRVFRAGHLLKRRFEVPIPRELTNIGLAFIVIWVSASGLLYLTEVGNNDRITTFDDALWLGITTLSTVGYGDTYPVTELGRLVAMSTMVLGVGVLGTLAATLATMLLELRERGRKGLRSWRMQDHLVVLGWNARSQAAIRDFRLDPRYREMPIVIVAELETCPMDDPDILYVRGNASRRETLERASAATAAAAMIFARDSADARSDHRTALTVIAMRRLNKTAKIGAEIVDSANHEHFDEAGCDAVIDFSGLGAMMLVRGIQDVGVTEVVEDLLSNDGGSELYRIAVHSSLVGMTFKDAATSLIERDVALIGIERGEARILNPERGTQLEETDFLFVVARTPPFA